LACRLSLVVILHPSYEKQAAMNELETSSDNSREVIYREGKGTTLGKEKKNNESRITSL